MISRFAAPSSNPCLLKGKLSTQFLFRKIPGLFKTTFIIDSAEQWNGDERGSNCPLNRKTIGR